jgi:phosphatidate cytidylyltransferase
MMQSELRLRILSGIVLAVVVLAATWFGGLAFRTLAAAIGVLVYYEWSTITRLPETDFRGNAFGWVSVVLVSSLVLFGVDELALPLLLGATAIGIVYALVLKGSGWLAGGIVYSGLTVISLATIRGDTAHGFAAMLFIFAVVWATDILAYFIGRAVGGPKLAPSISPGKTWSGAIGGALSAVIAGTLVHMAFFSLNGLWVPIIALVLSAFSQIGDLFESFIKRRFGAKDSSRLIPGHGGVMDRVDGLVFACFAAFLIVLGDAIVSGTANTPAGVFLFGP